MHLWKVSKAISLSLKMGGHENQFARNWSESCRGKAKHINLWTSISGFFGSDRGKKKVKKKKKVYEIEQEYLLGCQTIGKG